MSKYIRTKDGRILRIIYCDTPRDFNGKPIVKRYWYKENKEEIYIGKDDILKQADTIEELCDEFVYCDKDDKPYVIKDLELNKSFLENRKQDKIYGAIWTDKGLIYIAKMNDRGELELL